MDGNQLLMELVKITDMKIDLMEYVIEKMTEMSVAVQRNFVKQSSTFDKIDWLNMEFLSNYQRFLMKEGVREIGQVKIDKYPGIRDLKHLVSYALELETSLEALLIKL